MVSVNKRKRSNSRVKTYRKKQRTKAPKKRMMKKKRSYKRRSAKKVRILRPSDMQLVKISMPGPKPKLNVAKEGRLSYTDTHAQVIVGNTGTQQNDYGKAVHTAQMINGVPFVFKNQRLTTAMPAFTLDPNRTTTGSSETSATLPVAPIPVQFQPSSQILYCSHQRTEASFTNFASIAVHCEIRWLLCKNNSNADPITAWANDLNTLRNGQSNAVIPATSAAGLSPGAPFANFYGEDPTNNVAFKKFWKVLNKQEFVLPAGTTVRFQFTRPIHKLLKESDLVLAAPNEFLKGLTFLPMFTFKPSPVDMYVTSETAATAMVNTGSCKVGYMQTDTVLYHTVKDRSVPLNSVFTANVSVPFAAATQQHIDDDDDVQVVVNA